MSFTVSVLSVLTRFVTVSRAGHAMSVRLQELAKLWNLGGELLPCPFLVRKQA